MANEEHKIWWVIMWNGKGWNEQYWNAEIMETAQSDKKETSLAIMHLWFTLQKHLCCNVFVRKYETQLKTP